MKSILDISDGLPEVSPEKLDGLPVAGWAVEYQSGNIMHHMDIRGLLVDPQDPPLAVSYLGLGEPEE